MLYFILTVLLFGLSFLAGMMGLGVAFIATPVLGLFGFELKHEIMPLSLWLNGVTAIAGAITFARKGMVDWRTAVPLLIITTLVAPIGVWLIQFVPTTAIWWMYVGVLIFLAYREVERDALDARWVYYSVRREALDAINAAFGAFFDPTRIKPRRVTCRPQSSVVPASMITIERR